MKCMDDKALFFSSDRELLFGGMLEDLFRLQLMLHIFLFFLFYFILFYIA